MGPEHRALPRTMRYRLPLLTIASVSLACGSAPSASGPVAPHAAPVQESQDPPPFDVLSYTRGQPACFHVARASGDALLRTGGERCAQRFSPCSTFKIPNSIIGLETGVLQDARSVIPWDRERYPQEPWWPASWTDREHDLSSAFSHSFVPFYRSLATRVGADAMGRYVRQFRYGNEQTGPSLDSFWLDGAITISADEQVRFLRDFYFEKLGVSSRSTRIVKEILVHERSGDHVLSAKTGTCDGPGQDTMGWVVGYVERGEDTHFYALNVSGKTLGDVDRAWRFEILGKMLGALRLWPAPGAAGTAPE
jgi:beta-lactamase class D